MMTSVTAPLGKASWSRLFTFSQLLTNYLIAIAAAAVVILVLTLVLPKDSIPALFLLDHSNHSLFTPIYPITIQNFMHVMLAIGFAEVWTRWQETRREERYLGMHLLPEDDATVLQVEDLGKLRRGVATLAQRKDNALPRLIDVCLLQLITNKSVEQAVTIFSSTLELISHRIELAYQTMRYLVWLIPTVGFIGTVVGIAISLEGMQDPRNINFARVTSGLSVAFYTTILALLESAVLVFVQNVVQRRQEGVLNAAADYCLRNLINRTYIPKA
jgi:biopolymer transport protein ExbB/TolQ